MNKPIPFGKYFLLERINVGGMAEVFKAKTVGVEGFERVVALKRILPSIAEDEEFITMFIDEAKIAVQLQHANIAQIFDLGKVDDSFFIALEYVNGRDLRGLFDDLRKRGQTMPMAQVCFVIMQLCEGLDYAHNKRDSQGRELNLVHRDVSPQNVLIGYDGEVKLIDFGIAKAAGKASKTQAGILKGKFGYMSPEQVRGLPIDRRSDIFALGIVLYEMLTGERLFIGESDFSTLEKVRNVDITPPSSINSEIPEKLERIVLKALEKNVEDRYQNAIDLHDDLQLFLHSVGRFSSRKDLSAWMKRTIGEGTSDESSSELEELEEVEPIDEPTTAPNVTPAPTPSHAKAKKGDDDEFGWDEEEMETQIFDKDPLAAPPEGDSSFQSVVDEKTVAGVPSDALLAELGETFDNSVPTRPTGSAVPAKSAVQPVSPSLRKTQIGGSRTDIESQSAFPSLAQSSMRPTPPPAAPSSFDPPAPALRQTLMGGMQAPAMPIPGVGLPPPSMPAPAGPAYPTLQPMSGPMPGMPMPGMPAPGMQMPPGNQFPGMPVPPPSMFPQAMQTQDGQRHMTMSFRAPSKVPYYVAFIAFMLAGAVGTYMYLTRPGKLQVAVRPQDAKLSIDGVRITSGPPYLLQKRPGTYRLTLSQDGYITKEQTVQISPGQEGHIDMDLVASPDTGFDLTSQPPGGLVWLDGQPLTVDDRGTQAVANFHASGITPGRHVIEIRGNPNYKDWRWEFFQEPNKTVKVHADLEPIAGGKPAPAPSPSRPQPAATVPTAPPPPAAPKPERPEPAKSPAVEKTTKVDNVDDIFEAPVKPTPSTTKKKPASSAAVDDVFESEEKLGRGGVGSSCTVSISSKPWAEVSIDGKATGKVTPLVDYPVSCGTHRITFKNADLMIERNESITVKPGRPFKKTFSLVESDL